MDHSLPHTWPEIQTNLSGCCLFSCNSWRIWESLCGDTCWFQEIWFKWKIQGLAAIKILVPNENTSLQILVTVAYLKLFLPMPLHWWNGHCDLFCWWSNLLARNEKDIVDLAIQFHSEGVDLEQDNDSAGFLGVQIKLILTLDSSMWCRKVRSNMWLKLLALILKLQMESSQMPKGSHLLKMCMESLSLVISTTSVWLECSCILLDTHTLTLRMLSTVLQDICSAQSLCTNMGP